MRLCEKRPVDTGFSPQISCLDGTAIKYRFSRPASRLRGQRATCLRELRPRLETASMQHRVGDPVERLRKLRNT